MITNALSNDEDKYRQSLQLSAKFNLPDIDNLLKGLTKPSEFSNCLQPLLQALEWFGHARQLVEAFPHFSESLDITGLRNIMVELKYTSKPLRSKLKNLDERLMPCLYVPDNYPVLVLLEKTEHGIKAFNGITCEEEILSTNHMDGVAYIFKTLQKPVKKPQQKTSWFTDVLGRFRILIYQMLLVGLILNVFILSIPLFIMLVYDQVISSGSVPMLSNFTIGVMMAMIGTLILQALRTRIFAFIGARLDHMVGNVILERLLYLSPSFTESAPLGAQIARIKDFDTVREFFTGSLFAIFFELPFVFLFLYVIWYLAGPLVIVPLVMMSLFLVISIFLEPVIQKKVLKTAESGSIRQSFQLEALNNIGTIKYSSAERTWYERYKKISAEATTRAFKATLLTGVANAISDAVMTLSGLAVVLFGVKMVFTGEMSVGALIATMMLVWRVITPIKKFFSSLTKLSQVYTSIKQINTLMSIEPERDNQKSIYPIEKFKGKIEFNRVSFRYRPNLPPALIGVSFTIQPGEIVCVIGRNGSGKSTLLKLIPEIYIPQAGGILIDNHDVRQQDSIELRHAIAYLPQHNHFFYGTIEQNLRLGHPTATVKEIIAATRKAGVFSDIMRLPMKFQTRLRDGNGDTLPADFQQRLALARTYVKEVGVMLFDEPGNTLDWNSDKKFMETVQSYRGDRTVIIVTHRPGHLKISDRILFMDQGQLLLNGTPEEVLPRIPKDYI